MTKTYVYAHYNLFENTLNQKIIVSDKTPVEIVIEELIGAGWDLSNDPNFDFTTIEGLKYFAFNCDNMVDIIEVPEPVGRAVGCNPS